MANLDEEHTNFYYEFQAYKDNNENVIRDIVIRMTMEKMLNTLETYDVKVKTTANRDKTLRADVKLKERAAIASKTDKIEEMMDRKLDKVYERIRNDNWVIWKESIKLAEREFSEGGIKKSLDLLPQVTYDKKDLKRTINSLMHEDAEQWSRPVLDRRRVPTPPKKKKSDPKANVRRSDSRESVEDRKQSREDNRKSKENGRQSKESVRQSKESKSKKRDDSDSDSPKKGKETPISSKKSPSRDKSRLDKSDDNLNKSKDTVKPGTKESSKRGESRSRLDKSSDSKLPKNQSNIQIDSDDE